MQAMLGALFELVHGGGLPISSVGPWSPRPPARANSAGDIAMIEKHFGIRGE